MSFGLTVVTTGYMSSVGTDVGVVPAGAVTLPLMGWSGPVGDMRPAHFLSPRAMQAVPLEGLRFGKTDIPAGKVRWVALGYLAVTVAVFAPALAGFPLVRL